MNRIHAYGLHLPIPLALAAPLFAAPSAGFDRGSECERLEGIDDPSRPPTG